MAVNADGGIGADDVDALGADGELVAAAIAAPTFNDLVVHEARLDIPDGFVKAGTAPSDQMLNLRLALVNSDMAGLEDELFAVSTPGGARYGLHLTKEQVRIALVHFLILTLISSLG